MQRKNQNGKKRGKSMDNFNQTQGQFSGNAQPAEMAGEQKETQTPAQMGMGMPEGAQNLQQVVNTASQKPGFGSRIGYFFLAFVPLIVSFVLQFAISLVVMLMYLVPDILSGVVNPADFEAYMEHVMQIALDTSPMITGIFHVLGSIIFFLWYYFTLKKPRPTLKKSFGWFSGKSIAVIILCGVTLNLLANGTVVLESILTPSIVETYMEMAEIAGLGVDPFVIFASIVLAPIGEELLCRGLTLRFANKAFGNFWVANVLQAVLFGVLHMNWVQGIYAFLIGLALGYMTKRYNSIIPAMICHCVVNFSSTTWIPIVLAPVPANIVTGLLLTIVPTAATIWLFVWDKKKEAV